MKELNLRITFTNEALGMMPQDADICRTFIASKAPDAATIEDEIAAIGADAVAGNKMTVFPRSAEGKPMLWDYQIKGWLKDGIGMLRNQPGTACKNVKNYKKRVDGLIFVTGSEVEGRGIPITVRGEMGNCQRPLRNDGPSGSIVALAYSETVPKGSSFRMQIQVLNDELVPVIKECLNYGTQRGMCQWRNAGKGTFTWQQFDDEGNVIDGNADYKYTPAAFLTEEEA